MMDIESIAGSMPWNQLFTSPLTQTTPPTFQNGFILSHTFSCSQGAASGQMTLTLAHDQLYISEGSGVSAAPQGVLPLTFDLKFEVLHQEEKNIKSPKTGFKLYFEQGQGCSFYGPANVVDVWAKRLGHEIHQKGFHERFKPLRKLGKGNFATVYQVQRIVDGVKFACKAFSKQACFSANKGKQSLINQLAIMRALSRDPHQNILNLNGVYQSDNSIYVVMELLTGGQLHSRIQERNGTFTTQEIKQCMFGLVSALSKMHQQRYMHRDLKPENIMLRDAFTLDPIIVDFGLASHADVDKYLFYRCGTPGYVAPQIVALTQTGHVEPQCDMFSVGVIFHILLTKKPVFEGTKYDEVYKKNKEMNFTLTGQIYQNVDPKAMDLLAKMLAGCPKQRISACLALKHPYFEGVEQTLSSPAWTAASRK